MSREYFIKIRVSEQELATYKDLAEKNESSLSEFIRSLLDFEIGAFERNRYLDGKISELKQQLYNEFDNVVDTINNR